MIDATIPMNLVLVSQEYPPETGWGGIGTYVRNLAKALADYGHYVWVIALGRSRQSSHYQDGKVQVWRLPHLPGRLLRTTLGTVMYSLQVAVAAGCLARHVGCEPVIEAPEWFAESFTLGLGQHRFPLIVKLHTPHFLTAALNGVPRWKAVEWLERQAAYKADAIHAPSHAIARLVGTEWGIAPERIEVLPYPVDTELYYPAADHRDDFLVIFVGRLERRKGVLTIAQSIPRILASHSRARFVFIGRDMVDRDGVSMRDTILGTLQGSGCAERVVFQPQVSRSDLVPWYQRAAVTLIPSLWENFPNVCLEAMACGSTIVASNVGGITEIIDSDENGILIPADDPTSLADRVTDLLGHPTLCKDMGSAAAEKAARCYGLPIVARRATQSYYQLQRRFLARRDHHTRVE